VKERWLLRQRLYRWAGPSVFSR